MSYRVLVTGEVEEILSNLKEKNRRIIKNNLEKLGKTHIQGEELTTRKFYR